MRAALAAGVVLLTMLFEPKAASAQISIWLQRGISGYGGSVGVARGEDVSCVGVAGGYSWRGTFDFDLALRRYTYDEEVFGGDVAAYGFAPAAQYHPLKQSADFPVSIGIGAGYERLFVDSEEFDAIGYEIDAWSLSATGHVYRFFRLGERSGVIPTAGLIFSHAEVSDNQGNEDADNDFALELGGHFAFLSDTAIWGISPFIGIGENLAFGISFGVVISQPPE